MDNQTDFNAFGKGSKDLKQDIQANNSQFAQFDMRNTHKSNKSNYTVKFSQKPSQRASPKPIKGKTNIISPPKRIK